MRDLHSPWRSRTIPRYQAASRSGGRMDLPDSGYVPAHNGARTWKRLTFVT
jgi:hypothetical protein